MLLDRFLSQFKAGRITKFEAFSKYPFCYKDVSFWLPSSDDTSREPYHENYVYEVGACVCVCLVQRVGCLHMHCLCLCSAWRARYRMMHWSLIDEV